MGRLLIVEDNAELAENLAEILECRGHDVMVAHDVEHALACCRNTHFEGIISDYRLPGRSGIDLIEHLRSHDDKTPIVLMTGFADSVEREAAERLGALAVMFKPLSLERLFELVEEFGRTKRKVLVLEDNVALAQNLADALRERGYLPLVVHNVREALAQHQLPEVAIVDYVLPDGNGLEVARQLSARDPELRVLLVTGHCRELDELRRQCPAPFIAQTLEKPVPVNHLLNAVETLSRGQATR